MYVWGCGKPRTIYVPWSVVRHTVEAALPVNCYASSLFSRSVQMCRGKGKGPPVSSRISLWASFSYSSLSVFERWFTASCLYDSYIICEPIFCLYDFPATAISSFFPTPLLGSLRFPNRTDSTDPDPDDPPTPTKNLLLWYSIKVSSLVFVLIIRLGRHLCAISVRVERCSYFSYLG